MKWEGAEKIKKNVGLKVYGSSFGLSRSDRQDVASFDVLLTVHINTILVVNQLNP